MSASTRPAASLRDEVQEVLYFLPRGSETSGHFIFMGRDKVENEDLIKYGLPEDIWFHVDKLSSAHVYMRVQRGQTMADLSKEELEDCCQLVKANSIQGNKDPSVTVVYTPWANLRKTSDMEVGQVGFVSDTAVKRFHVAKRCNETVNRLNKTRRESFPDLAAEREAYDVAGRAERKAEERARRKTELELQREREREQQERSYDRIMGEEKMMSNRDAAEKYTSVEEAEEDFM